MSDHKLAEALRGYIEDYKSEDGMFDTKHYVRQFQEALAAHEAEQQEGEEVGEAGTMPGTSGFTMACFHADKVPLGTKLFTHPQQPLSEAEASSIFKAWREGPLWLHMTRGVEAAHKIGITKDTKAPGAGDV